LSARRYLAAARRFFTRKPRTCQRITKITTAIRAEHSPAATRRQQCVTTASGL
jgi:hypothetical protein